MFSTKTVGFLAFLVAGASAFAPQQQARSSSALQMAAVADQAVQAAAAPYAKALFDYAEDKKVQGKVSDDAKTLEATFEQLDKDGLDLASTLSNPTMGKEEKRKMIKGMFGDSMSAETVKFMNILVDKDRIGILETIISNYIDIVNAGTGVKVIEVTSATEFSEDQIESLEKNLKKVTGANSVTIDVTIDTDLIGGFVLKSGTKIVDLSVKDQLERMAKHLGSTLEI